MSRARVAAVLVFAVSLILFALIITDALPALRGPAADLTAWHWPYALRPLARWWPALLAAAGLLVVGTWWVALRPERRWPVVLVALLALCLQLGVLYAGRSNIGAELVDRTLSKDTSGYVAVAGEIDDLNSTLRHYPELLSSVDNEHVRTHPPGLVVAAWLTDRALRLWPGLAEAAARPVRFWRCNDLWVLSRPPATAAGLLVWSWLPVLSAALVPVLALLVARRLLRGAAVALAATLSATISSLLVFSPTPDQLYALLSLAALWLLLKGLSGPRWPWLLAAGFVLSVMTMLSVGNIAWAGMLFAFAMIVAWRCGWPLRGWALGLGALAVGGASLWVVYWLGWGIAPWVLVRATLEQHYQLVTSQRDYATWLAYNPLDVLLFAGLGLVVGWGGLLVAALLRPAWRQSNAGTLALLLGAMFLLLNLSGGARGEVGRLWLVFMPLMAVLAGGGWAAAMGTRPLRWPVNAPIRPSWPGVALVLASQLLLVLAIGLAWRPLQAIILPVVRPSMDVAASAETGLDAIFATPDGKKIGLTGFTIVGDAQPGAILGIDLFWEAHGPTFDPYTVSVQLVDQQGSLVAQQDNWPVNGAWPTTCWQPNEPISDPYQIRLPDDLVNGPYRITAGLYDAATGERLQTTDGLDRVDLEDLVVGP